MVHGWQKLFLIFSTVPSLTPFDTFLRFFVKKFRNTQGDRDGIFFLVRGS